MTPAAQLIPLVGVKVEVSSHRQLPNGPGTDIRQELDRIRLAVARIEQQLVEQGQEAPPGTLADDAIVDQRSVPAPPDLYLRLARNGAFPSQRLGKRVVAKWGDVRRAFLAGPGLSKVSQRSAAETADDDGLDALRARLGLVSKGK